MRSVALRPGRLLGAYPELPPDRVSPLGRAMRNLGTPATWLRSARDAKAQAFLRAVNDAGEPLRKFDAAQLDACTADLRARLQRHGLRPDLTARAFALVREFGGRTLGLRHFDEQVIGGWAILDGLVAEMDTGEGKTLTATLPACAAALAGIPVHVVTVNDYLAQRDRELMAPLYAILGVRVGVATPDMPDATRARAYACDVTYVTNKQVAFDYLRDRVAIGHRRAAVYRSIDRMSGRPDDGNAPNLLLRGLCFAIVDEADSVLIDEARTPLKLSGAAEDPIEAHVYRQAIDAARELDDATDWHIDTAGAVALVDAGRDRVARRVADADRYFLSPRRRNALIRQALTALHLFERDRHYLVRDGAIEIIDENTGRVMQDRTWEMGLHQLIEAKEGLAISRPAQTLARITYQRFFRRYLKLGAMTGTAREVAGELQSVYDLAVHRVPPHRPSRRKILPAKIFATADAKWDDVVARAITAIHDRRPVLIGTKSVAASDALSATLNRAGIESRIAECAPGRARGGNRRARGPRRPDHRRHEHGRARHRHRPRTGRRRARRIACHRRRVQRLTAIGPPAVRPLRAPGRPGQLRSGLVLQRRVIHEMCAPSRQMAVEEHNIRALAKARARHAADSPRSVVFGTAEYTPATPVIAAGPKA